jgi:predicted outer membrane repeat protein
MQNFKYLDNLIHSGENIISLTSDIALDDGEISNYKKGIELDIDDLVIDGEGHTIDACGNSRIFKCTAKNVTIKNVVFKNGSFKYGGAINNYGGNLTIIGCEFSSNCSDDYGGAIRNSLYATLKIRKSLFFGNCAIHGGGAVHNNDDCILRIEESTFRDNHAKYCGAVFNNAKMTVSLSFFESNRSVLYGGAIGNDGELEISDSSMRNNVSKGNGGALANVRTGRMTVSDSTFTSNSAEKAGAVYNTSLLSMRRCTLSDNKSEEMGGAILNNGTEFSLSKSVFADNASKFGGALLNYGGKFKVIDSTFKSNMADTHGGAIYNFRDKMTINGSRFEGNVSNASDSADVFNRGWLIMIGDVCLSQADTIVNENSLYASGWLLEKVNNRAKVHDLDMTHKDFDHLNHLIQSGVKRIELKEDIILNISSGEDERYADGIRIDCDGLTIDGCGHEIDALFLARIFDVAGGNVLFKNVSFRNGYSVFGGAINNANGDLTIVGCRFENDVAARGGGSIFSRKGSLYIFDSSFAGNSSNSDGGAICCEESVRISLLNCELTHNSSRKRGGTIFAEECEVFISESKIQNSKSESGGAISNKDGKLTISTSLMSHNKASSWGGAICSRGVLNVGGGTFSNNFSKGYGGAIYAHGKSRMDNSAFNDNTSMSWGGAIMNDGRLFIDESSFSDNASNDGAIVNSGVLVVGDSQFSNNTTKENMFTSHARDVFNRKQMTLINAEIESAGDLSDYSIINDGNLVVKGEFSSDRHNAIRNHGRLHSHQPLTVYVDNSKEILEFGYLEEGQGDFTYLNQLINGGASEIRLDCDFVLNMEKDEEVTFREGIKIDCEDLVIDGNGHSIDAQNLTRIFEITGSNIIIRNVLFKRGFANSGAAIYNNKAGKITVCNSSFLANRASSKFNDGAAIHNEGWVSVSIKDCIFKDNEPLDVSYPCEFEH